MQSSHPDIYPMHPSQLSNPSNIVMTNPNQPSHPTNPNNSTNTASTTNQTSATNPTNPSTTFTFDEPPHVTVSSAAFKKGVIPPKSPEMGNGTKVAIITARWNAPIVQSMKNACITTLTNHGVDPADIHLVENVPGAFELPFVAKSLILHSRVAEAFQPDAVIALGCLIKGDTPHFEYISQACTMGLAQVGLETGVAVIMGVLTCLTEEQAKVRAGLSPGHNHGEDYAFAAMEMAQLKYTRYLNSAGK